MDAANILKPALSRGEIQVIGATTVNEYRKNIEKDSALERRFQPITVGEPTVEETIEILKGIREKYENHHQVRILDEAIIAAVDLSIRYISNRFLPDKAIDLVDEAASRLRLQINSLPEELENIERKIRQLGIEREAIKREKDKKKIDELSKVIDELNDERSKIKSRWETERGIIEKIQKEKKNIEQYRYEAEIAERDGVDMRMYRIIYDCIEEIEAAMKGMLAPKFKEVVLGHAEVRQTIHVPNVGTIAGSYITDGKIIRSAQIRIVRDGIVIFEDKIASLRRFKDDVKEVADGYECGVGLDRFNDIKVGDVLEAFIMEEIPQ